MKRLVFCVLFGFISFNLCGQGMFYFNRESLSDGSKKEVKMSLVVMKDNSTIVFENRETDLAYVMECEQTSLTKNADQVGFLLYKGHISYEYNYKTKGVKPFSMSSKVEITLSPPSLGFVMLEIRLLGKTHIYRGYEVKE